MSENNRDTRENIDDVEKTVEDLKKKIQEISEKSEEEKKLSEDESMNETRSKIEEIRQNAVNKVNDSIAQVKKAAADARTSASENRSDTIQYLKDNAVKAVDSAKIKINDLVNNAELNKNLSGFNAKAAEAAKRTAAAAKEAADKSKDFISSKMSDKQKADFRDATEKAGKVAQDTARTVTKAVDDFVNKPEVQDFNKKAADLTEKGFNKVKNFFKKTDND